jgi:hypothetical protein
MMLMDLILRAEGLAHGAGSLAEHPNNRFRVWAQALLPCRLIRQNCKSNPPKEGKSFYDLDPHCTLVTG